MAVILRSPGWVGRFILYLLENIEGTSRGVVRSWRQVTFALDFLEWSTSTLRSLLPQLYRKIVFPFFFLLFPRTPESFRSNGIFRVAASLGRSANYFRGLRESNTTKEFGSFLVSKKFPTSLFHEQNFDEFFDIVQPRFRSVFATFRQFKLEMKEYPQQLVF